MKKVKISQCDDCEREFYIHALFKYQGKLLCEDCKDHQESWDITEQRNYERSLEKQVHR